MANILCEEKDGVSAVLEVEQETRLVVQYNLQGLHTIHDVQYTRGMS